jgi:hypothetical protein
VIIVRAVIVVAISWMVIPVQAITSEQARLDEYQVKAAFLFNFAKFVEWPHPAPLSKTFVIGVLGEDRIVALVEAVVRGKKVQGRRIHVRALHPAEDPTDCDILFVTVDEDRRSADLVRRARGASVLTIGESELFLRDGGIIRFVEDGHRIRFQINAAGAEQVGIKISSQLLSLAIP